MQQKNIEKSSMQEEHLACRIYLYFAASKIFDYFIIVNRFNYVNNKDRCSIPIDMTVLHGLHKFSLQATIDNHGPSMYSGHYNTSINCCKNILLQRQQNYEIWNDWYQNSSAAYVAMYELITCFLD